MNNENIDLIGHFHAAGVPGRHELWMEELNYKNIIKKIDELRYRWYFGGQVQIFLYFSFKMRGIYLWGEFLSGLPLRCERLAICPVLCYSFSWPLHPPFR